MYLCVCVQDFRQLAALTPLTVPAHTETFGRWMELFAARADAYVAQQVCMMESAFVLGVPGHAPLLRAAGGGSTASS